MILEAPKAHVTIFAMVLEALKAETHILIMALEAAKPQVPIFATVGVQRVVDRARMCCD